MSQFQNEAFQFDFVKCLVQTRNLSVATATDLSFHFTYKLLHILENSTLSKSILIICSQVIHDKTRAFDTLNFHSLTANRILIL